MSFGKRLPVQRNIAVTGPVSDGSHATGGGMSGADSVLARTVCVRTLLSAPAANLHKLRGGKATKKPLPQQGLLGLE